MHTFTVMPMSQNINLKAGETFTGSIVIAYPADAEEDISYAVSVSPYSVIGENYTADLLTESNTTLITDWITIENPEGTLNPNETATINFTITVPEDAPAGGQYAALTVRSANDETETASSGGINNIFEIASVIFADVEGETIHSGELTQNSVPSFSVSNPPSTEITVSNTGNVHEAAVTKITIRNIFTGETIFPTENDPSEFIEYIMPGTTRYSTRELSNLTDLGLFEVTQTVDYLGETSTVSSVLFQAPVWFLILAGITIVVIIYATIRRIKNRHEKVNL